jgi:hypothetical protein
MLFLATFTSARRGTIIPQMLPVYAKGELLPMPLITSIHRHFDDLPDPRIDRCKHHLLLDIITIAICAVISNADGWLDIEAYGRAKEAFFRQFLDLPHGIPSHDTFRRVFLLLDAVAFEKAFLQWAQALAPSTGRQGVAVDGKTVRRSHDAAEDQSAIGMVSAWATANRVVLGQLKVEEKSNEITAIPSLLRLLELKGCVVTIDAIGCQTDIAQTIVAREADYLLAVKGNQAGLYQEMQDLFADAESQQFKGIIDLYRIICELLTEPIVSL